MAEEATKGTDAHLRSPRDKGNDDTEVVRDITVRDLESNTSNDDKEETSSSKATSTENSPEPSSEVASTESSSETSMSSIADSGEIDSDPTGTDTFVTLDQLRDGTVSEVRTAAGLILSVSVEEEIVVEEVVEVARVNVQSPVDESRDGLSANDKLGSVNERLSAASSQYPSSPTSSAAIESPPGFSFVVATPPSEPNPPDKSSADHETIDIMESGASPHGVAQTSPQASGSNAEQVQSIGSTDDNDKSGKITRPSSGDTMAEAERSNVCKHCGREFEHTSREIMKHLDECEALELKKMLEENLPSQVSLVANNRDDASAPAPSDGTNPLAASSDSVMPEPASSGSNSPAQTEADDHMNKDTMMQGTLISETLGGDDDDDEGDDPKTPKATKIPISDKKHEHQHVQQHRQQPTYPEKDDHGLNNNDNDGYRVFHDPASSKIAQAECLYCGKILAYRRSNVRRHVSSCLSNPSNRTSGSIPADNEPRTPITSPPPAPKKALKRKCVLTKDDLADAPEQSVTAPISRKVIAPQKDLRLAISFQTPRRSKRIKRDPNQSPKRTATHADAHTPPASLPLVNPEVPTADSDFDLNEDTIDVDHNNVAVANSAIAIKLRDDESTDSEMTQAVVYRCMGVSDLRRMDHAAAVAWLFGSSENAAKMKLHYNDSVFAVHGVYARFHPSVHETLGDLKTRKLIEMALPNATFTLFVNSASRSSAGHRVESVSINSKHKALALYDLGFSLSLPAPPAVGSIFAPLLARDLQVSALVSADAHDVKIVCCQVGSAPTWQFYRDDCFVVDLKGTARWKTKRGPVRFPVHDYRPRSSALTSLSQQYEEETRVKVHCMSAGKKTPSFLLSPSESYRMTDDDSDNATSAVCEMTLAPGSVMYMPGGTWFEAEVIEDTTWLEIRLASMRPTELIGDAVRQLCAADEQWRRPLLQTQDVKATRKMLGRLMKELETKVASLSPFDLLPEEVLLQDGDTGIAPASSSRTDIAEAANMDVTIDLSKHRFRGGKHIKIFKTTGFRENHLAFLTALHELPSVIASRHDAPITAIMGGAAPSRDGDVGALKKKALKKKLKKSSAHATQHTKSHAENVYVVHVNFGSADFHSKVRVEFQCDAFQAAIVEWIRKQVGAPFHASDALKFVQRQQQLKKPHDEEEGAKYVLRFLCTIGYISPTKIPTE